MKSNVGFERLHYKRLTNFFGLIASCQISTVIVCLQPGEVILKKFNTR